MSSSSYTSYRLSNIIAIVRRANNHVSRLAAATRTSLTPTHHAKRRAQKLKLKVDIDSARNLDHKQVSTVPLPVLATPPSLPLPLPLPISQAPLAPLREPVVFRENEISRAVVGRERELRRAARPLLRCEIPSDIAPHEASLFSIASAYSNVELETPADEIQTHAPVVLRGQNVPWRPVTSRWSVSTVGSENEGEIEAAIDVNVEDVDIADAAGVYAQGEESARHSRAHEGSMDLPIIVSPDSPAGPYGELEYVNPRRVQSPELVGLSVRGDTRRVVRGPRHLMNLDVDMARISWGSSSSTSSSSPSSAGTQSSSSDSGSSASSATSVDSPTNQASSHPNLMVRIKRSITHPDVGDSEDTHSLSERRPKYGRKSWAAPYPPVLAGRRQSSRISAVTNMNTNHTTMTMTNRSSNRF